MGICTRTTVIALSHRDRVSSRTVADKPHRIWSSLRGLLTQLTFATMKDVASACGLPTAQLSHLRQTRGGGVTKSTLADAIDSLFNDLDGDDQDRVAVYMVKELTSRLPDQSERLGEHLERIGWHLVEGESIALDLRVRPPVHPIPDHAQTDFQKAIRRYRDGDFTGAMTATAGMVDMITKKIYDDSSIPGFKNTSFQNRVITAHKMSKPQFEEALKELEPAVVEAVWEAQVRAVNGAAEVVGRYRNEYGDSHGSGPGQPALVPVALNSALFLVDVLTPM